MAFFDNLNNGFPPVVNNSPFKTIADDSGDIEDTPASVVDTGSGAFAPFAAPIGSETMLDNMHKDISDVMDQSISAAESYINGSYLGSLSSYKVIPMAVSEKSYRNIRIFKLEKFVYDSDENINDKLMSVYSALQNIDSSALVIVRSYSDRIEFYLGVKSDNAATAGLILEKSMLGNFPGSTLNMQSTENVSELMNGISVRNSENIASVTIIPSSRDEDKDRFVQGMEKFIDTMLGEDFTMIIIAKPLNRQSIARRKTALESIGTNLSSFSKIQMSYGANMSKAVTENTCNNFSESLNNSISEANSYTKGTSSSTAVSKNKGHNWNFGLFGTNKSSGTTNTRGVSDSFAKSQTKTSGTTLTSGSSVSSGISSTEGDSRNMTLNYENKTIGGIIKKIDEHLERMDACASFGMWECAAYFSASDVQTSVVAASTFKALVSGDKTSVEGSYINMWGVKCAESSHNVAEYLKYCSHPMISVPMIENRENQTVTPGCLISGSELPLMMGLPKRSVAGVSVLSIAEFGRNVYSTKKSGERVINLGNVYHMGREEGTPVMLDVETFSSHCFITGSTGSGKSNTSYRILDEMLRNNIKFLVIEPAKGEYKKDFGTLSGINIFGTNPYQYRMLKINPFKFHPQVHILEHLDRLIEIFSACWPMYAAMPAIFKEAIENSYIACGWDLASSIHIPNGNAKFPTFKNLLDILPKIINDSSYSADSKGDYTGALVTRVRSMTTGISGQIFCGSADIEDSVLFDENTIVDLSRVGAAETKSLIMGIMVMKLNEYRMSSAKGENVPLQHVTVLEEAHNLLKRTSTEQSQEGSNLMGKSVEMISSSIAEMRTYGEGFIIIDQSPTAVDISAIKNTNTKIVMRLPEKGDCEAIGKAMALNEKQIDELSKLGTGKAVVFQNNWLESVLTAVAFWGNKYKGTPKLDNIDEILRVRGRILECLYRQYVKSNINTGELANILLDSDLSNFKKLEMYERVVEPLYGTKDLSSRELARVIIDISSAEGLFKALPQMFEGEYLNDHSAFTEDELNKAGEWHTVYLKSLNQYFTISDPNIKEKIAQYMLYNAAATYEKDHRFILLYHAIYNRGRKA